MTTTERPARGSGEPSAATGPTTITAGERSVTSASWPSVVRTSAWFEVVPRSITATGVEAAFPPRWSSSAMVARFVIPMRITRVPSILARISQSTLPVPVTTVTDDESPRWVTGMPTAAGTPKAEETPGTTSQRTPARVSASASSPPRPNTKGSPPFKRTTVGLRRPCSTRRRLISACPAAPGLSGRLPTSISSADSGARARTE